METKELEDMKEFGLKGTTLQIISLVAKGETAPFLFLAVADKNGKALASVPLDEEYSRYVLEKLEEAIERIFDKGEINEEKRNRP